MDAGLALMGLAVAALALLIFYVINAAAMWLALRNTRHGWIGHGAVLRIVAAQVLLGALASAVIRSAASLFS